jgi:glyoxylase-like metal-dependent hydrolase (beta-lactamase superfamily II)
VPGIHLLGGLGPSPAYLIESSQGLILIDSGLQSDALALRSEASKLGLDWRLIRAIFLTHVHGDHTAGAERLRSETGAKVHVGRGDAAILRAGMPREAFFSNFYMPDEVLHPTVVDVELNGGETFTFADTRVLALSTPGHTPGSVCYLVERNGRRVFFGGDVVMDAGTRPVLGTYSAYLAPRYRGDAKEFLSTLRRLREMPSPDLVLAGHAVPNSARSAFMTQGRWVAMIHSGIRELETLLARYSADGADFLDGTPKELLTGLYYLGEWQGAAVYGFFASTRFFLVDAPGGSELLDFVNARLRQLGLEPAKPAAVLLTSCGPEAIAGIRELVEKTRCLVVARPEGHAAVRDNCPKGVTVLSPTEFGRLGWFELDSVLLEGRGRAPIAYLLPWSHKSVLFSGRIPIKINQEAGVALFSDFMKARGSVEAYLDSLNRLLGVSPDLWLPAVPVDGQNANLYDSQWAHNLAENQHGIELNRRFLSGPTQ